MLEERIGDLFDQINHYEGSKDEVVVTHPIVRDMTQNVLDEKLHFNENAKIPEGTTYFGFFDPQIPDAEYCHASSKSKYHRKSSIEAKGHKETEELRSPFDKVSQRELSKEIGIFKNPRYIDVRKLFSDSYKKIEFKFIPEDFTDFPYDEIISGLEGDSPRSYIFHNMVDGFRIRKSKNGGFTISGRNTLVQEANNDTKKIKDPHLRLETFLSQLSEKKYSLETMGYNGEDTIDQQEQLVDSIVNSHKGNIYIKDARTGGGYLVVRVRKEGIETHIESDSPSFKRLIERREDFLEGRIKSYDKFKEMNASQFILDDMKKLVDGYDPLDPKGILHNLFRFLENPIIEEEIPYETVKGNRAEFRLICQRVFYEKEFSVTGYSKISDNGIAANISLGGHGQTIEHVLKEIYSKGTPNADENKIKGLVAKTEKEILQKAKKFAKKVYDHYDSDEFVIEKGLMPSSDFAVDLVPSWNEKTNKLDLYFLEINREYGYSGLREIDPTKAIQVGVNKRLII